MPIVHIVQLRFGVVDIAPVAEGVVGSQGGCQGAGDGEGFAPRRHRSGEALNQSPSAGWQKDPPSMQKNLLLLHLAPKG